MSIITALISLLHERSLWSSRPTSTRTACESLNLDEDFVSHRKTCVTISVLRWLGTFNSETEKHRKPNISVNVFYGMSNQYANFQFIRVMVAQL